MTPLNHPSDGTLAVYQTRYGLEVYLDGRLLPSVYELHPNWEEGYIDLRVPLAGVTLNDEEVILHDKRRVPLV